MACLDSVIIIKTHLLHHSLPPSRERGVYVFQIGVGEEIERRGEDRLYLSGAICAQARGRYKQHARPSLAPHLLSIRVGLLAAPILVLAPPSGPEERRYSAAAAAAAAAAELRFGSRLSSLDSTLLYPRYAGNIFLVILNFPFFEVAGSET
jgi:hypothetical protein